MEVQVEHILNHFLIFLYPFIEKKISRNSPPHLYFKAFTISNIMLNSFIKLGVKPNIFIVKSYNPMTPGVEGQNGPSRYKSYWAAKTLVIFLLLF